MDAAHFVLAMMPTLRVSMPKRFSHLPGLPYGKAPDRCRYSYSWEAGRRAGAERSPSVPRPVHEQLPESSTPLATHERRLEVTTIAAGFGDPDAD